MLDKRRQQQSNPPIAGQKLQFRTAFLGLAYGKYTMAIASCRLFIAVITACFSHTKDSHRTAARTKLPMSTSWESSDASRKPSLLSPTAPFWGKGWAASN